jgi:hypothetical protein
VEYLKTLSKRERQIMLNILVHQLDPLDRLKLSGAQDVLSKSELAYLDQLELNLSKK